VVDPNSGEILALARWPLFNPNDYGDAEPDARKERAAGGAFEPGSTVKMFTIAARLAAGVITPTQKMSCEKGLMPVDNVVIRDTHPSEWLTISQILAISSNICAAKIGLGLGEEKLYDAFRRFGFGEKTGVDIGPEASGLVPTPEWRQQSFTHLIDQIWKPGYSVQLAIGQGDLTVASPRAESAPPMAAPRIGAVFPDLARDTGR
jgi:cell division protein FtsI/penicillin-binding protein 2